MLAREHHAALQPCTRSLCPCTRRGIPVQGSFGTYRGAFLAMHGIAPPQREHGPKAGHIIAHLGSTDNKYLLAITTFRPACCPAPCGHGSVHHDDDFQRHNWQEQVPILRFRCGRGRCRQMFSILPSYLPPGQFYSTATGEAAVIAYPDGEVPLATVAEATSVGTATVFLWVDRACAEMSRWLVKPCCCSTRRSTWRCACIRSSDDCSASGEFANPQGGQLMLLGQRSPWVQRLGQRLAATFGSGPGPGWMVPLAFWRLAGNGPPQMVSTTEPGKGVFPPAVVGPGWRCSPVTEDERQQRDMHMNPRMLDA